MAKKKEIRTTKTIMDGEECLKINHETIPSSGSARRLKDSKTSVFSETETMDNIDDLQTEIAIQQCILEMEKQKNVERTQRLEIAKVRLEGYQLLGEKLGDFANFLDENPDVVPMIKQKVRKVRDCAVSSYKNIAFQVKRVSGTVRLIPSARDGKV